MQFIRGSYNIKTSHQGCVLTIGNFDGVHRGHQALLKQLKVKSQLARLPLVVMLFEPQPLEFIHSDTAPRRLMNLRSKLYYLEQAGVDYVLCERFNQHFAAISAQQFIDHYLIDKFHVAYLSVGEDFRFGYLRQGDISLLQEAAKRYKFEINITANQRSNGVRISSTVIRQALLNDNITLANELLGHEYSIRGRVIHGRALGRTIGFPTANIAFGHTVPPVNGVYAIEVRGIVDEPIMGVANIGKRPTIGGQQDYLLEAHLFNFNHDIYGSHINVVLKHKIRNEQRFDSIEGLMQQIHLDVLEAEKLLLTC